MRALTVARGLPMPSPLPRTRWRVAAAPAPEPVPVKALTLSVLGHLLVVAALVGLAFLGVLDRRVVHVVNLVSNVAMVGNPAGSPASLPARTIKPPPRANTPEPEPIAREAPKPSETALPARVITPRAGERDLPPLAPPSERRGKTVTEPVSRPSATPLGQVTGSISGQGALTLDVTDFPYAWYLRQVLQKVEEHWQTQNRSSEPAQKPRIYVEIRRDGSIAPPRIEESSGSSFYDRAALRAITEASPFPPLPADWAKPSLRVLFNFDLRRG
jgi:TonB family protein